MRITVRTLEESDPLLGRKAADQIAALRGDDVFYEVFRSEPTQSTGVAEAIFHFIFDGTEEVVFSALMAVILEPASSKLRSSLKEVIKKFRGKFGSFRPDQVSKQKIDEWEKGGPPPFMWYNPALSFTLRVAPPTLRAQALMQENWIDYWDYHFPNGFTMQFVFSGIEAKDFDVAVDKLKETLSVVHNFIAWQKMQYDCIKYAKIRFNVDKYKFECAAQYTRALHHTLDGDWFYSNDAGQWVRAMSAESMWDVATP